MAARTARGKAQTARGRSSSTASGRTANTARGRSARGGRPRDPQAEVEKLLKAGKKEWDASKDEVENIGADNRVPAGTYEVKLVKLTLVAKDGKLSLMRKHMVTDGEFQGDTVTDFMRFTSENGAVSKAYIRRYFETLEIDIPEDPSELPALVEDLTKEGYEGKLRVWYTEGRDRQFLNAQLTECYPEDDGAAGDGGSEAGSPDEGGDDAGADDAPADDAPADDGDGSESLDDMDKPALVKLIADEGIPIKGTRRKTADQLRAEIREYDAAQEAAEGGDGNADAAQGDDDAEDRKALAAFCKAQGLDDASPDLNVDDLCKLIAKYEYERDKLDKEDIELLESFKLGDVIVDPEPPKPAARRSRR